jgi:carbon storage regulator
VLVLTRHANQSIVIGHDIVVTVLEVRGDQVRLGITAPQHVQVHREEVFAALMAANQEAAASGADLEVLAQLQRDHPKPTERRARRDDGGPWPPPGMPTRRPPGSDKRPAPTDGGPPAARRPPESGRGDDSPGRR